MNRFLINDAKINGFKTKQKNRKPVKKTKKDKTHHKTHTTKIKKKINRNCERL